MDDLEIEFELLQQHIAKLEAQAKQTTTTSDEVTVIIEDDEEDDLDLENTVQLVFQENFNQFSLRIFAKRCEIISPTMLQVESPPRSYVKCLPSAK